MIPLLIGLACTPETDPVDAMNVAYVEIMADVGVAERDTSRNIRNKEARRRKARAESARVGFFAQPDVQQAIDTARESEDATQKQRGEAYHRHRLMAMGWTDDEKVSEQRMIRELEEARGAAATWTSPDGTVEVSLRGTWANVSRVADDLDEATRGLLAEAYVEHQMEIVEDGPLLELIRLRNDVAKRVGFNNYWELAVTSHGLDALRIEGLVNELSTIVKPVNTTTDKRFGEAARKLGLQHTFANVPTIRRRSGLDGATEAVDAYADTDQVEEAITTALHDMGIRTGSWQIYTGPSRTVRSGVYGYPIRPPQHVALVMSVDTRWSVRIFELFAHEAGHLVWWNNLDPSTAESPPLWEPPAPWAEGFAGFFEGLVSTEAFLERYLPQVPEQARKDFAAWSQWQQAERLSDHIVATILEQQLYTDPNKLSAITRRAAEVKAALHANGPAVPMVDELAYAPALVSSVTWNYPGYRANFLQAAVTQAQVDQVVRTQLGEPVGNPDTGPFITNQLVRGQGTFEDRLLALSQGAATDALKKSIKPAPVEAPEVVGAN